MTPTNDGDLSDERVRCIGDVIEVMTSRGFPILFDAADLPLVGTLRGWVAYPNRANWYARRSIWTSRTLGPRKQTNIFMHRLILSGCRLVDHLNGNGLDNRRLNLRAVDHAENNRNRAGAQVNSQTGIRGVHYRPASKRWLAQISHRGERIYLGSYRSAEAASAAYLAKAAELWAPEDLTRFLAAQRPADPAPGGEKAEGA